VNLDRADLERLSAEDLERVMVLLGLDKAPLWSPLPGPQSAACNSLADITGFGGAAGGGKTDLAIGLALTQHQRIGIFRQNGTELSAIVDRVGAVLGGRDGYNGSDRIWRFRRHDGTPVQIELGSFPSPFEELKYQGRPHDLLVFDEASNMREIAVRFLLGWLRSTDPKQRKRALLTFNPPTTVEGRWVVGFFAPWLDKGHPHPAAPGELRWFTTVNGRDVECDGPEPVMHEGEKLVPLSRTFIPSRLSDNPYLRDTGYMATLQAMPEPLRSQMLYGDFSAGVMDDPWQVIPTGWVEHAMSMWSRSPKLPEMDSIGCDVARGGADQTIIARRHGMWFDEPIVFPGSATPDGPSVAAQVLAAQRDQAVLHIDVIGVGASPYDFLMSSGQQVLGINVGEKALGKDLSGRLAFRNLRSELWWRMREALDPKNNTGIVLPPDKKLLADLCAPTWSLVGQAIAVAPREEIIKRIGRSPDYGSAYVLALIDSPKRHKVQQAMGLGPGLNKDYDPYRGL
jgi:hypothetical protein